MTPGARIAAAIEILEQADAAGDRPVDRVISQAFSRRRYAGSKDRRAIAERIWAVLRARARLDWWIERTGAGPAHWRRRIIAHLVLADALGPGAVAGLFSGEGYAAPALDEAEDALTRALAGASLDHAEMPPPVALEYPDWLADALSEAFGDLMGIEMAALNEPAAVDLRVNTLRAGREDARALLAEDGIEAQPTALSPVGLRVRGRARLDGARAFREGLVEVQDEGSQLVALMVGAKPGMGVFDVCAGAGGKTLALAAAMEAVGRIVACDSDLARLKRMEPRLRRAGLDGVEVMAADAADSPWAADDVGAADRVLVDAPCSGSGAWRRHPEARWRLTPDTLAGHVARKARIIDAAAALVAPGGRLVYATCSVLGCENAAQVTAFLDRVPGFRVLSADEVWAAEIGAPCPFDGPNLVLTPARAATDGFFAAVLERTA
jgi:16S rRNA (cytosine967-C5)-methyltransferase